MRKTRFDLMDWLLTIVFYGSLLLLICSLICSLTSCLPAAEVTTNPITSTVQVRYGHSAGTGTAIGPQLILTCNHIHEGTPGPGHFTISKHWQDGSDHYQGYLLVADRELDLALIVVPEADLAYVSLAAADAPVGTAASWYGHAKAAHDILSFRGQVAHNYSTHFDLVRGHDSIEGQSGGGVFDTHGHLLGVMHGRPHTQASAHGGAIFTPLRNIRRWLQTQCNGPRCQPYLPRGLLGRQASPPQAPYGGAGQLTPPPPRQAPLEAPSQDPDARIDPPAGGVPPAPPVPAVDLAPIVSQLERIAQQVESLEAIPGPPGPPGKPGPPGPTGAQGVPGTAVDVDALAAEVLRQLPPIYVQTIREDGTVQSSAAVSLGGTLNLHHQIIEQ